MLPVAENGCKCVRTEKRQNTTENARRYLQLFYLLLQPFLQAKKYHRHRFGGSTSAYNPPGFILRHKKRIKGPYRLNKTYKSPILPANNATSTAALRERGNTIFDLGARYAARFRRHLGERGLHQREEGESGAIKAFSILSRFLL